MENGEMLTEEIWMKVLSYLTQKELCILAEVNQKFRRLARDPSLWHKACGWMEA